MNSEKFEGWFENKLLKTAAQGKTIVMDRASFHRKTELEKLCAQYGAFLLYLPSYSPDLNPIESAFMPPAFMPQHGQI